MSITGAKNIPPGASIPTGLRNRQNQRGNTHLPLGCYLFLLPPPGACFSLFNVSVPGNRRQPCMQKAQGGQKSIFGCRGEIRIVCTSRLGLCCQRTSLAAVSMVKLPSDTQSSKPWGYGYDGIKISVGASSPGW